MSSRTEEKFTRKLEDPFYKESIKISDLPLAKLLDRIRKVTSKKGNEADKEQFSNDVLCKTFFSFGRSGKSSSITALVKSDTHLDQLHKASYELIEWYAEHPLRASISSMYNNLGMPDRGEVEKLVASCSDDKGKLNEKLFRSITGMQAGCGMPDLEALKALEVFCTKDGEFNQDLFSSITGMQSGRGVPDLNELPAFLEALEALEVFCTKDGEFNQDLFSSITGMQCGRGVPDLEALKALEVFCTKDGEFNQDLFSSITGMQTGRGVPDLEALKALEVFCTKGEKFNQDLFRSITGMQSGRGVPKLIALPPFLEALEALEVFCTKGEKFNQDLFRSITGMQNGLGVPDNKAQEKVKDLQDFCTKDKKFNQDLFRSITGMQCGRGVPDLEALKALEVFCTKDGEFNQDLFRSITGMQNGCGVPNLEALRELKDFCIKSLINSGSAWQELFSSICVMQIGSGIPEPAILAKLTELYSILQGPELKSWLKEKLLSFPINERLPELYKKLNSDRFKTGNPLELYAMLPPEICPKFSKLDLSTAYVRLDLRDQIVFLSSGEERVVASILYKYGLIKTFNDGENLHVRASKEHRIDLDFLLDNIPLFIEYHPLSQRERKSGRDIKQAAQRKINSTLGGDYHDHEVLHIEKLNDLPGIFINHPQISRLITQHLGRQLTTEELNHDLKQANDSSSWTEIPINKISA